MQVQDQVLRRRDAVLEAVSFAAQRFLNSPSWTDEIELVLEHLGRAAGVERLTVRKFDPSPEKARLLYSWDSGKMPGLPAPVVDLSSCGEHLESGHPVAGPLSAMPESGMREILGSGVRSAVIMPIFVAQAPWGVLNFMAAYDRAWIPAEVESFRVAGGLLGGAIGRNLAEEGIRWREALLSSMAGASPLAFYVVDNRTDRILYFNRRFCQIWGIEHLAESMLLGELRNNDVIPSCIPVLKDVAAFAESCKPLQDEFNRIVVEDEIPFADGRIIRRFSTQIRDRDDRYFGRLYLFEDITAQRRMQLELQSAHAELEQRVHERTADLEKLNSMLLREIQERRTVELALARSEQHFRALIENTVDVILLLDEAGLIRYASPSLVRMLGYEPEDWLGQDFTRLVHPEDLAQVRIEFAVALRTSGSCAPSEFRVRDSAGQWRVVRTIINNQLENRLLNRLIVTFSDITERKNSERILQQSEQRYRAFVEQSTEGIWRIDFSEPIPVDLPVAEQMERMLRLGFVAESNNLMARRYKRPDPAAVAGMTMAEALLPYEAAGRDHLENFIRRGYRLEEYETYQPDEHGNIHCLQNNVVGLVENGCLQRCWGTQRDVTDRKAAEAGARSAEEALRQSEALYRSLVETSPDAILLMGADHVLRMLNPQAMAMFGFKDAAEAVGHHISELVPEGERSRIRAMICGPASFPQRIASLEVPLLRKDGSTFPAEISASMLSDAQGEWNGTLVILRDITDRKQAEEARKHLEDQFRQSQKMEAIGTLAGGVAHDFNNLLTVIMGYCELLLRRVEPANPIYRNLGQIKRAADRASGLVQQLLAFSRKQIVEPQVLNVSKSLFDLEKMLRRLIGEDIDLITWLDPEAGCVTSDPGQIEQMVLNLTVNARDAMPHGGTLVIECKPVEIPYLDSGDVPPGSYVLLSVRDTGTGMTEEIRTHAFEPFFTTKEVGKGTGLGLSTVYGIVKQAGGCILLDTEPGKGTEVRIYLPRVQPVVESVPVQPAPLPATSRGVILLVEDEDLVRMMMRDALQERGYSILEARNGEQALDMAEQHPGKIQLLLTDVVMPRMSGPALAQALMVRRPEMKVLLISGYSEKELPPEFPLQRKPFTPTEISRRVHELLGEA